MKLRREGARNLVEDVEEVMSYTFVLIYGTLEERRPEPMGKPR